MSLGKMYPHAMYQGTLEFSGLESTMDTLHEGIFIDCDVLERMMKHEKMILIADDDYNFRSAMVDMVSDWGYEVLTAKNGLDVWEILLGDNAPRIMILDWIMPGMDGVEICKRLRSRRDDPYVYIILVSIQDQIESLTEGISAGADDYLTKPVVPEELEARLLAGRRILDLQAELMSARDALQIQATHDPLTNLWNRKGILDILDCEVNRASRDGVPLSVIMVDVDDFKYINDSYGHPAGDKVLIEIAERMRGSIRSYDSAGRLGGDEFLMVLPGCDAETAQCMAERVQKELRMAHFPIPDDDIFSVSISMGIASSTMGMGLDANDLVLAADSALLRAKQMGKNRVEIRRPEYVVVM
jgi:two-component system cell cycle response regulator